MDEERIKYIVNRLDEGFDEDTIKAAMADSGYEDSQINELFSMAKDSLKKEAAKNQTEEEQITPPQPPEASPIKANNHDHDTDAAASPKEDVVTITEEPNAEKTTSHEGSGAKNDHDHHKEEAKGESLNQPTEVHRLSLPIIVIGTLIILFGGIAYAAYAGLISFSLPSFSFSDWFSEPPYGQETLLEDIQAGFAGVGSGAYNASFVMQAVEKDSDTYLLPKTVRSEDYEEKAAMLTFIPSDLTATAEVTGKLDVTDEDNPISYSKFSGEYNSEDFSLNAELELILSRADGLFFKINRLPSLFLFDVSDVKNEWMHLIDRPLTNLFDEQIEDNEGEQAQYKFIMDKALEHNIFRLEGEPEKTEFNGETAYRYQLSLDGPAWSAFLETIVSELDTVFGGDHMWADLELEDQMARISDPEYVEFLNTHFTTEIWARADGIPVRYGVRARLAVDEDVELFSFDDSADAQKTWWLYDVAFEAQEYLFTSGSYTGFCDTFQPETPPTATVSDQFGSGEVVVEDVAVDSDWVYDCNDNESSYAVEVLLEDGSHCIDSTGYNDEGSILLVGDTVCDSSVKAGVAEAEEEAEEAERQINLAMFIELTNINEPIVVELPTDALSLEEAAERVPAIESFMMMFGELEEAASSAQDASSRQILLSIRSDAEIHYNTNFENSGADGYEGFCNSETASYMLESIESVSSPSCVDDEEGYAIEVQLSDGYFCVDNTGYVDDSLLPQIEGTRCVDVFEAENDGGGASGEPGEDETMGVTPEQAASVLRSIIDRNW